MVYQRYRCKACFRTFNDKHALSLPIATFLCKAGLMVLSFYGHLSWRRIGKIFEVSDMTVFGYGKAIMEKVKR